MAEPRSWIVLKAFAARLLTIQKDAGFHTDAGSYVELEPKQQRDTAAPFKVAVVFDGSRPSGAPARPTATARRATVAIVALAAETGDGSDQLLLHSLIEDIEKAFPQQQAAMGAFQTGFSYPRFVSSEAIPRKEGSNWIGAIVRYECDYVL